MGRKMTRKVQEVKIKNASSHAAVRKIDLVKLSRQAASSAEF
jgi:hypothetical protein